MNRKSTMNNKQTNKNITVHRKDRSQVYVGKISQHHPGKHKLESMPLSINKLTVKKNIKLKTKENIKSTLLKEN